MCIDLPGCHYFLRDNGDGECKGYTTIESGDCRSPYTNSPYYDLYQVNYEPAPSLGSPGTGPGNDGVLLLLQNRKNCNARSNTLANVGNPQACADLVNENGQDFFMYDPNDGECRVSHTSGPNCPEGFSPSQYYDFYQANGGGSIPEASNNHRLIAENKSCGPKGQLFGNVAKNAPEECAEKCEAHQTCKYFNYDPNDGECF